MGLLLVALCWLLPARAYHVAPLDKVEKWTYVEACGLVAYVRHQEDGDWHITLTDGTAKLVVEIIPAIPLAVPRKGQTIRVRGISRRDVHHNWLEIHPAETILRVRRC